MRKKAILKPDLPVDELVELTDHESGRKFVMTNKQYQGLGKRVSELIGSVRVITDEKRSRPPGATKRIPSGARK